MASFNQSPLGQANVGLALSTTTLGIGTISSFTFKDNISNFDVLAEGRTIDSIVIPIDLRPTTGLLYPR